MPTRSKSPSTLTLTASAKDKPSDAQRRFNKLLGQLETLRERIAKRTRLLELELKPYAEVLAPAELEEELARRRLLLKLGEFWTESRYLKKGQRSQLRDYILEASDRLRPPSGAPDETPLIDLITTLSQDCKKEAGRRGLKNPTQEQLDAIDFMATQVDGKLLQQMDPSGFVFRMPPEDFVREYKRQVEILQARQAEAPATPPDNEETTARERQAERAANREAEREAARMEVREQTLSTLYKQLAKVLHPDLERDPARQTEKLRLMQKATEAYRNRDLATLLQLEVEHLRRDEGDVASLTKEKLHLYAEVLTEQVELLRAEYDTLVLQPRFECIAPYVMQYRSRMPNWTALARSARANTAAVEKSIELLSGSPTQARKELQETLYFFEVMEDYEVTRVHMEES